MNTISDFSDILLEEPTSDFFNNNFDYDQDLRLQSQWVAQWQAQREPWGEIHALPPGEEEHEALMGPYQGPVLYTDPDTLWQDRPGSLSTPEGSPWG